MADKAFIIFFISLFLSQGLIAQSATSTPSGFAMILQVLVALGFVIALIFATAWIMKKVQLVKPSFGRQIKVIESLSVGRKEKLLLVELNNTNLLIGVGSQSLNVLHEYSTLDDEFEKAVFSGAENSESDGESFSDFLKSILVKEHKK